MADIESCKPLTTATDEAVMAIVCVRSDRAAFSELVARWSERLNAVCLRLTGNADDAEDAVQEAFAKAFAGRSEFRGNASFSTWFWKIAVNVAHDVTRRRRLELMRRSDHPPELCSQDADPLHAAIGAEQRQRVMEALGRLTETQRTVVILRHYQQLKFREIADVLGIPPGTAASRMAEALSRLSELLTTDVEEDRTP